MTKKMEVFMFAIVFFGVMVWSSGFGTANAAFSHAADSQEDASPMPPVDASAYSKTMTSTKGRFKVTYSSDPETIPVGRVISWKLQVLTAAGKPVQDAKITIAGDMPEHGHGLPTKPRVTKHLGGGEYLVEGLKFSMPGWWTMTFTIKSKGMADNVTFHLKL